MSDNGDLLVDSKGNPIDEDRYGDDPSYRIQCGPSLDLYGDMGYLESLVGLGIQLDFGKSIGSSVGTAHAVKKDNHYEKLLSVKWICDGDTTTYESVLSVDDFLQWYFHDHTTPPNQRPNWLDEKEFDLEKSPFLVSPSSIESLANWEFPLSAEESGMFEWAKGPHDDQRWWTTIACLNDPANRKRYDPTGKVAYPASLLLTMCLIIKECHDPSTKLPMIVTKESKAVLQFADQYSAAIRESGGGGHGYNELHNLSSIVNSILKDAKRMWSQQTYQKTQALILTLSDEYESGSLNDDYRYCDDLELMGTTFSNILQLFKIILLDEKHPIDASDREFLKPHLEAGPYEEPIEDDNEAEAIWGELSEAWEFD